MTAQTTFQVLSAPDFIKVRRTGEPDLEEAKKAIVQLAMIIERPADYDILIDCRAAQSRLTYSDIYQIVLELCRHRDAFRNKIAILTRADCQFDKANFLEEFANARGFNVAAFTEYEQAIEWLSESFDLSIDDSDLD